MVHLGNLVRANDTTPLVVINATSRPSTSRLAFPEGQAAGPEALSGGRARLSVDAATAQRTVPSLRQDHIHRQRGGSDDRADQDQRLLFQTTDRRLWPGQFVNVVVTLTTDRRGAIVAPTAAVQSGQQGTYVFLLRPDKTVELRSVTIARAGRRNVP